MTGPTNVVLMGAVAMASLVAALFFLRFWQQTRDVFFALFSVAFAVDAIARFALGLTQGWEENSPFYYLARLLTFCLIIVAIALKNRPFR
jgi:uncharacterized membrane protein HdeD (DUF308 family)